MNTPKPIVLIYVSRDGVEEVQVHACKGASQDEGDALYENLRPLINRISKLARAGAAAGEGG